MPICSLPDRHNHDCYNTRCGTFRTGYVYGLLDERIGDIFYVGSTVQSPGRRYSEHMRAAYPRIFREAWIMAILADGSLPVLLSLGEFHTKCELELKSIEHAMAADLHAQGHTALCDLGTLILHSRIPIAETSDSESEIRESEIRENLIERAIAEHLDQVNEQARIQRWLRTI